MLLASDTHRARNAPKLHTATLRSLLLVQVLLCKLDAVLEPLQPVTMLRPITTHQQNVCLQSSRKIVGRARW